MHSKIYQMSLKPIEKDDYVSPGHFYDKVYEFADYIGKAYDEQARKESILGLSEKLHEIFDLDGEALVYKGMGSFVKDWYSCIQRKANELNADKMDMLKLYHLYRLLERTHIDIYSRFYIEDLSEYAKPLPELINFIKNNMKSGDRLYIGAVIDYHF